MPIQSRKSVTKSETKATHDPSLAAATFIRSELLTGITLSRIAIQASDPQKKSRNHQNARKAYDALMRYLPKTILSPGSQSELEGMLGELRVNLKSLGEEL